MKSYISKLFLACALSGLVGSVAKADESFAALSVYPTEIKMNTAAAFQNVVAVATRNDGVTVDVTIKSNGNWLNLAWPNWKTSSSNQWPMVKPS